MLDYLRRLFRYDAWANRETLRAIETAAGLAECGRATKLMAHIIAAEWLWLRRMGQGKAVAVWPELTLTECVAEVPQLATAWQSFFDAQTDSSLSESCEYTNSKGERWTNVRQDILTHVAMHSAYHRGQIAAELRAHSAEPAYTDFIEAVRRGKLE